MMGRVIGRNTDVPHTWLSGAADSRNAFVSPIGIEADCDAPIKATCGMVAEWRLFLNRITVQLKRIRIFVCDSGMRPKRILVF